MKPRAGAFLFLGLTGYLHAAEVRINPIVLGAADECLRDARLVAVPLEGESRELTFARPPTGIVAIPDGRARKLSFRKEGCWSDVVPWRPGDTSVAIHIGKSARLRGRFENRNASFSALQGQLFFRSATEELPIPSTAVCTIAASKWECIVPAGTPFDLRLDVKGYASAYYWDLLVPLNDAREVEPQTLQPGADLVGWVQDPRGKPASNARVACWPSQGVMMPRPDQKRAPFFRIARTNERGFFQIFGLTEGAYRLVSTIPGASPLVVPEITIRGGESVRLPRPLRHDAFAELELVLDPPTDPKGKPWVAEMTESSSLYPNRPPRAITRRVGTDGHVLAQDLRATTHRIVIREDGGATARQTEVDLFGGGHHATQLTINRVRVRGVVRAGGEALDADLQLSNTESVVTASTAEDGSFEVLLPTAGKWLPVVIYPRGRTGSRTEADMIEIPDAPPPGDAHEVVVNLPGGRITGEIVTKSGEHTKGLVHILRDQHTVGFQYTGDDGKFDVLGLKANTYLLAAQAETGGTPAPVSVSLGDGEKLDVRLVTEPYAFLTVEIVTPDGLPATGALVRVSEEDGDGAWFSGPADVHGRIRKRLSSGTRRVQLMILTYSYPALLMAVPVTNEPLRVRLRPDGGVVRFGRKRAIISGHGITARTHALYFPEPLGRFGGGIFVQTGSYVLCELGAPPDQCKAVNVTPGSDQQIELGTEEKGSTE